MANDRRTAMTSTTRRKFVTALSALTGGALARPQGLLAATEPQLETRRIRFVHAPSICTAPMYLAEDLLRMDGFDEVQYLPLGTRNGPFAVSEGRGDFIMWDTPG